MKWVALAFLCMAGAYVFIMTSMACTSWRG
jgi:hypothetical protein